MGNAVPGIGLHPHLTDVETDGFLVGRHADAAECLQHPPENECQQERERPNRKHPDEL